ncbi:MAG: DUF3791 domain-containing protein [Bacteroidales bacterium]|nr:DUF3791 domain-containing protein [Bacteroidales bacterium]
MTLNEMQFVTYCVGCVAEGLKIDEPKAFKLLYHSRLLEEYIVPCFNVLHSFGREYLTEDLIEQLKKRGAIC